MLISKCYMDGSYMVFECQYFHHFRFKYFVVFVNVDVVNITVHKISKISKQVLYYRWFLEPNNCAYCILCSMNLYMIGPKLTQKFTYVRMSVHNIKQTVAFTI